MRPALASLENFESRRYQPPRVVPVTVLGAQRTLYADAYTGGGSQVSAKLVPVLVEGEREPRLIASCRLHAPQHASHTPDAAGVATPSVAPADAVSEARS